MDLEELRKTISDVHDFPISEISVAEKIAEKNQGIIYGIIYPRTLSFLY